MRCYSKEQGVSEAIGFLIIFTIVVTGIGLVTLYGYPELQKHQINADERNMEQNLITLQNDMNLLCYSNIPYKNTAMRVSSGSLSVHDLSEGPTFIIKNGTEVVKEFETGHLTYESEGTAEISFENGAVVKKQRLDTTSGASVMIAEPRWFVDNNTYTNTDTLVIFLMGIKSDKYMSLNGIGNVQMNREEAVNTIIREINGDDVYIEYTGDYKTAWKNYLTSSSIIDGGFKDDTDGYKISNIERLIIKTYNITIENV